MEATELLMSEHRIIESFLLSLEKAANMAEQKQDLRPAFFSDAADFSKGFTDGCHHRKEEGYLFKALACHGLSETSGPVAVLLEEHEQGRRLIKGMRAAAQSWSNGDPLARERVLENAKTYVSLIRQHIQKEDGFLFPLSDQVIPLQEQEQLKDDFEQVEAEEVGAGVHEKFLALARNLEKEVA